MSSMKAVIFNIHDVALLLIAGECGILALLLLAHRGASPLTHRLLGVFLLLNALVAADTLMYWGEAVHYWVFSLSPNLFFLFGFAYFLLGPVLYWYTRSTLGDNYSLGRLSWLHLLPAVAAQVYLYFVYHRYPEAVKGELVLGLEIFSSTAGYHDLFVTLQKSLVVAYGVACLVHLGRYRVSRRAGGVGVAQRDFLWLHLLAGGCLLAWAWSLATHFFGLYHSGDTSDTMGITGNYLTFVLVNILVVCRFAYFGGGVGSRQAADEQGPEKGDSIDPQHLDRIRATMETERLFLNPRLTLDEFAGHVKLPSRQVSSVIKQGFGCNFLEFVNGYRVEEARRQLASPANSDDSVLEIASKSGFNSKATFNRFFKKCSGITPSEYRRRSLPVEFG